VTVAGAELTTIKFVARDGGPLDEDGVANGEFVDPNGPSVLVDTLTNTGAATAGLFTLLGVGVAGAALMTKFKKPENK
jgi:hypothetical protein